MNGNLAFVLRSFTESLASRSLRNIAGLVGAILGFLKGSVMCLRTSHQSWLHIPNGFLTLFASKAYRYSFFRRPDGRRQVNEVGQWRYLELPVANERRRPPSISPFGQVEVPTKWLGQLFLPVVCRNSVLALLLKRRAMYSARHEARRTFLAYAWRILVPMYRPHAGIRVSES